MIVSLISFIVTPFIYPIVYWLPDSWRAYKPLWYFFDDEDGLYGPVYWRNGKGITKRNFWVSYKWLGLRNRMWNLQASLKPIIGKEEMVECSGDLTQNGKLIDLSNVAVLIVVDVPVTVKSDSNPVLVAIIDVLPTTPLSTAVP